MSEKYDTIASLPQDIKDDYSFQEVMAVGVVHPGINLYGERDSDLITVEYWCEREECGMRHHLLYGPRIVWFADGCKNCEAVSKWLHTCDKYEAFGYDEVDRNEWELYAS